MVAVPPRYRRDHRWVPGICVCVRRVGVSAYKWVCVCTSGYSCESPSPRPPSRVRLYEGDTWRYMSLTALSHTVPAWDSDTKLCMSPGPHPGCGGLGRGGEGEQSSQYLPARIAGKGRGGDAQRNYSALQHVIYFIKIFISLGYFFPFRADPGP